MLFDYLVMVVDEIAQRTRSAARTGEAGLNTPSVHAGRLERQVWRVGRETMPGIHGFCSVYSFGAIRGVPLLRLTAVHGHLEYH